jgi:hypothetical protein
MSKPLSIGAFARQIAPETRVSDRTIASHLYRTGQRTGLVRFRNRRSEIVDPEAARQHILELYAQEHPKRYTVYRLVQDMSGEIFASVTTVQTHLFANTERLPFIEQVAPRKYAITDIEAAKEYVRRRFGEGSAA